MKHMHSSTHVILDGEGTGSDISYTVRTGHLLDEPRVYAQLHYGSSPSTDHTVSGSLDDLVLYATILDRLADEIRLEVERIQGMEQEASQREHEQAEADMRDQTNIAKSQGY